MGIIASTMLQLASAFTSACAHSTLASYSLDGNRRPFAAVRANRVVMAKSEPLAYNTNLRAEIKSEVNEKPKARVHSKEWQKIQNGDPVEINPSVGYGYKVMTVDEWSARWKRNDDFKDCLNCGCNNTKEHHFTQTWCRGKKHWESETLCLDCHSFSWRSYRDPDFMTPEDHEKEYWNTLVESQQAPVAAT